MLNFENAVGRIEESVGQGNGRVFYPFKFENDADPATTSPDTEFNPMARSLADMVSAKQSVLARLLAGYACVDENEVADDLYGCEFGELSKAAASLLIEYLQEKAVCVKASVRLAG